MVTTIRAALSVALLLGFYLYALVLVVVLGVLSVLAIEHAPGVVAGKVVWVTLAVPFAILAATWKVLRAGPPPPVGLALGQERAPGLWLEVRRIAAAMGTRPPDDVRLVPEANAAVHEDAGLLGLRAGRRHLYVGVPLLQALTVDQVRAVLAHELGHYSQRHTRLGMLTYRGMDTIDQTIARVGHGSLAGWMLRGYRRLYLLVSLAVRRRQELEADRAAVRVAGPEAMASVLRAVPAVAAAWAFYLDSYVAWGLDVGVAPCDVLASFPHLLSARAGELARIRAEGEPELASSRWDSHPPTAQRLAAIAAEPGPRAPADRRPASVLVDHFDAATARLESQALDLGGRSRLPFEQYTAAAAQALHQREADLLYRAADRVAPAQGAGLDAVLDLVEGGRAGELQRALFRPAAQGDEDALAEGLRHYVTSAIQVALVDAGAARWRHSWTAPVELVDFAGEPLAADRVADVVVAGKVAAAREWLRRAGVEPSAAVARQTRASAAGAQVIGAIANLVADGRRSDLLVLSTGLLLVRGVGRLRMRTAKRRLHAMASSARPEELAAAPGNRFIPYEEVAACRRTRRFPKTYELSSHDGGSLTIRWGMESEELGDGYAAWDQAMNLFARG
jgi:Zn-dependent protease with chaperone function